MDDLKERAWCEWWEEVENFGLRAERAETDLGRHAFAWCDAAFTAGYDAQAARIEALEAQLAARDDTLAKLNAEMRRYVYDTNAERRLWALDKFGAATPYRSNPQ